MKLRQKSGCGFTDRICDGVESELIATTESVRSALMFLVLSVQLSSKAIESNQCKCNEVMQVNRSQPYNRHNLCLITVVMMVLVRGILLCL